MSKIAFVFPGQGSQTVGMCKAFYDEYAVVREISQRLMQHLVIPSAKCALRALLLTYS